MLHRLKFPPFRRTRTSGTPKPVPAPKPQNPYRALEVKPGAPCCSAAHCLVGKRHLASEAPKKLPIPDCTRMDECACRFLHHEDRRIGPRRRDWDVIETKLGHELWSRHRPPEQVRRSRGRRKGD